MENPIIQRYRYSTLRPKQLWIYVTIYITITLLMILLNYSAYKYQDFFRDITDFYRSLFYQFLTFQIILLVVWGAYNSGSAIKEEISNDSYDFFRMLPLSAYKKAFGILIGKNLVVFLFAAINLVFLIYFGLSGTINIRLQWQLLFTLISITILANLILLLSSIRPAKKGKGAGIIPILFFVFFLFPMMMNVITSLASADGLENRIVYFFNMEIPILLLVSFIALYFSGWLFKGILRRFTCEQESLFTKKGAVLFLLGYIFIVIGLYYHHIPVEISAVVYSCWLVTLMPVLLIPAASLRQFDNYIEFSRGLQKREATKFSFLSYSNLSLAIILFAIWAVSSIGVTIFAKHPEMPLLPNLYNIFILLTSYLFLALLLELYVVYTPASNKILLLLSFIACLYIFLPLILSGVFGSDTIHFYSPIGFIVSLFDDSDTNITLKTTFCLMNVVLCVFPAILIWKRYNFILEQRQRM